MYESWQTFLKTYGSLSPESSTYLSKTNLLFDLPTLSAITISGPEAKKFLQGQLTCDLEAISPTTGTMGAHCNPQGRIISLFYIFQWQDTYYLFMPVTLIPIALAALKKYAVFYKAELTGLNQELIIIGRQSTDNTPTLMPNIVSFTLPNDSSRSILMGELENIKNQWQQLASCCLLANEQKWQQLDLQAGIPTIYPETSGKLLPHDINLPALNAVSFNKGCYTGQEIIARMHYRGKLKNHLYHASILSAAPLVPGIEIYATQDANKQSCGIMVAAAAKDKTHYDTLIIIEETKAQQPLWLTDSATTFFAISRVI